MERSDARLVLVGDTKQLQAIEAGRMFQKLQETGAMKTVSMSTVIRQKEETYLELVENVSAKRIDQAFNNLEKQGRITKIPDTQERFKAMVNDYVERKDVVIVTARNADRNDLNTAIRQELKEQERLNGAEQTFIVRESKSLSPINLRFANGYDAGDLVFARKARIFGRAGAEARVVDVNVGNHSITVERINNNHEEQYVIDLKQDGDKISAYCEKLQSFMENDRIVFLKNDKGLNVQNGVTGEIVSLDENGNIRVWTDAGKEVSFNVHTQYNYLDHGYAVTDYKVQGRTVDNVLYHADTSKELSFNQAYVALTRGREDVAVYTDSAEKLREQMKSEQTKSSTLDYEKDSLNIRGSEKSEQRESAKDKSSSIANEKEHSNNDKREAEKERVIEFER